MSADIQATASVSVPSADLINYRFDQADKRFAEMNGKLDTILAQNAHFITEDQVKKMIDDAMKPTTDTISNYRWYWRALVSATFLALVGAAFNLFSSPH